MLDYIKNHLLELCSLSSNFIMALVALVVSYKIATKGWWKNRNFYGVEFYEYYSGFDNKHMNQELVDKLNSGKYTILETKEKDILTDSLFRGSPNYYILLGKVKK